ncbi:signal peptide peptidase-like 2B [Tubulanus polymorphus]|uniref:signal peptide peptidase-like 2B n=1 Tax=Tubulanus polymorphus TaxID=672921 RepID=UPI003DA4336D
MTASCKHVYYGVIIVFLASFMTLSEAEFGVLNAWSKANPSKQGQFCILYNAKFKDLPSSQSAAVNYSTRSIYPGYACNDDPPDSKKIRNNVVFVARGNCTFSEKADVIQTAGGAGVLIVSKTDMGEPRANTSSHYADVNITVGLIAYTDYTTIQSFGNDVIVRMFAPETPRVDYNLLLIWLLAVGTVVVGGYWSGHVKHKQYVRKQLARQHRPGSETAPISRGSDEEPENTLDIGPKIVIVLVIMMIAMLVSLYFFYDYLVYVVIGLFCIGTWASLHASFKPLVDRLPCGAQRIPANPIPLLSQRPEYRSIALLIVAGAIVIWWAIERHASYAWVLQDFLGVVFCVHLLKTLRLPSLKACAILLVLLFFYDIFFVFITPLFTKNHDSVMVDVVTGGSSHSGEELPLVLKVPRLAVSSLSICSLPYSLLGFGDIIVPGLLVAYCHGIDLRVQSKKIYFIGCSLGYGIGLLITFIALAMMETGQPALLYLVPCTLLTTLAIGALRRELPLLWSGDKKSDVKGSTSDEDTTASGNMPTQVVPPANDGAVGVISANGNTASINNRRNGNREVDSENECLITNK